MDDLISRQAAIEAVTDLCKYYTPTKSVSHPHMDFVIEALQDLSPVTPQPKTGRWIKSISENGITSAVRCSECGFEDNRYILFRYCPNCGAKMEVEE